MKLVLHPKVVAQLDSIERHPAGSYLFLGPNGSGRYSAAVELMRRLNCRQANEPCPSCRQLEAGNHASLITITSGEKASIGIEQIRNLKTELALSTYNGQGIRVVIVDEAERLTAEAQNAMLKLMEEPPEATIVILVASGRDSLLPTIRSRCQTITFTRPDRSGVATWLQAQTGSIELTERALIQSDGLPGRALAYTQNQPVLEAAEALTSVVDALSGQSLFERLLLVKRLADDQIVWRDFVAAVERSVHRLMRDQQDVPRQIERLEAIEVCLRRLDANVTPRLAVEALLVEF